MKEKVLKKSPIVIGLYVVAALLLAYTVYTVISTLSAIASYSAQMEGGLGAGEVFGYVIQALVTPLTSAVTVFAAGFILNEVRKLNPANYILVEKVMPKTEVKVETKAEPKAEAKKVEKKVEKKAPAKKASTTEKKPAAKKPAAKKPAAKKPAAKKEETK